MPANVLHPVADVVQTNASVLTSEPQPSKAAAEAVARTSLITKKEVPHPTTPRKIPPRRIALSGGGIRTIAHCGALLAWRDEGVLSCVNEYLGVSGGAFIALILCLGYSLEELHRLCLEFDFNLLNTFDPAEALSFLDRFGLDTGHALEKLLVSILKHKGYPPTATFDSLPTDGSVPRLRVFATNLSTSSIQEFSALKTPNAQIVFAVRSSMSLPIYYTPMREQTTGHTYVDGGVLHNLPLAFLTEEEAHDTWGIMFSNPPVGDTATGVADPQASIFDYMKHLYNSMLQMRYEGLLRPSNHKILRIPCGHISPIHFAACRQEKEDMISLGAKVAREFVYGPHSWKPVRRNSVT
jgi:predicted acylesterase/phospholipase RssA